MLTRREWAGIQGIAALVGIAVGLLAIVFAFEASRRWAEDTVTRMVEWASAYLCLFALLLIVTTVIVTLLVERVIGMYLRSETRLSTGQLRHETLAVSYDPYDPYGRITVEIEREIGGYEYHLQDIEPDGIDVARPPRGVTLDPIQGRDTAAHILQTKRTSGSFDVFLCHNSEDKSAVREIAKRLADRGILPWLDEWQLRAGLPWQRLLEQQIAQIKSAAVFVGKEGIGPWQQLELETLLREFVKRGCPVIPVILGDARRRPRLPIFLKGMTWVDFRRDDPDPLEQLLWGITGRRHNS